MSSFKLSLLDLDYSEIPLDQKKTPSQIKVENEVELLKALDYYQERKSRTQQAKDAIETKNIKKLICS